KTDLEILVVRAVLDRLGLGPFEAYSSDRPDVLVVLGRDQSAVRLGCEVKTLHADSTAGGSELRRFRERWRRIMARVMPVLDSEGSTSYCRVDFINPSYQCMRGCSDSTLIDEFIAAGRMLQTSPLLQFPIDTLPELSRILDRIEVIDTNRDGFLWWPSH